MRFGFKTSNPRLTRDNLKQWLLCGQCYLKLSYNFSVNNFDSLKPLS